MAEKSQGDHPEVMNMARSLISLISRGLNSPAPGMSSSASRIVPSSTSTPAQSLTQNHVPSLGESVAPRTPRTTLQTEMQRTFPGFFRRDSVSGRKRSSALLKTIPVSAVRCIRLQFFLLPGPTERTPKSSAEIELLAAGLGRRTVALPENLGHCEIQKALEEHYPKLKELSGGWLFYKSSGGAGQRKLSVVTTEPQGYTAQLLKSVSLNGRSMLYIVPLQEDISCIPLPYDSPEFNQMPKSTCKTCGVTMPLQFLALHVETCQNEDKNEDSEPEDVYESIDVQSEACPMEHCPICGKQFDKETLAFHASFCGDVSSSDLWPLSPEEDPMEGSSTSIVSLGFSQATRTPNEVGSSATQSVERQEWKTISDPLRAAEMFKTWITLNQENEKPLRFIADLRVDPVERERSIIAFYKTSRSKWASPLLCVLEGDPATGDGVNRHFISLAMQTLQNGFHINYGNGSVTRLFEGQKDHLIPCASQQLLDSDLFFMAGRMVGHSFLHGGPGLAGLSLAVVHVLLGGTPETCTLTLEDCPDLDQRTAIKALEGDDEMTQEERKAVKDLTETWDLPTPTSENRMYLHQCLLKHAVLGRTMQQIKQMRKGLKETGVWKLLSERNDIGKSVFHREDQLVCCSEVIMHHIVWPNMQEDEDDDDEDYSPETRRRVMNYLKKFIMTASPETMKDLMRFWTGWEVPTGELKVEVVHRDLPISHTCFQSLRLPGHFSSYEDFEQALHSCISCNDTGFGLV